jgi:DNA-binding beta-propeller fold protein YncE
MPKYRPISFPCAIRRGAAALPLIVGIAAWAPSASAASVPMIYVANAGNPSTVTAINADTDKTAKSIPIKGGTAVNVGVAPSGLRAYALVVGSDETGSPGLLVPINTRTNVSGRPINVGTNPKAVAFNPDGRFAYVVDGFDAATTPPNAPGTITPINLDENAPGKAIRVGTNPGSIAITPNGHTAYVTDSNGVSGDPTMITPINLATNTPEQPIHVAASAIAITLNGMTAFALARGAVVPIPTATNRPGKRIRLGGVPEAIDLAPDGQTAWVLTTPDPGTRSGSNKVVLTAINTATFSVGKVITMPSMPTAGQFFIAITPNGAHIYVLGQGTGKTASTVVTVDAATDIARKPIKAGIDGSALAVNPDNKFVYVLSPGDGQQGPPTDSSRPKTTVGTITPIAAATNKPAGLIKVGVLASAMAVRP